MRLFLKITYTLPLFFFGCSEKQEVQAEVDVEPVEVCAEEPSPTHHEDEDKVIADLSFFISEKQWNDGKNDLYLAKIRDEHMLRYTIGNYEATWASPSFENDSLYFVLFSGQPFKHDDYESRMIQQCKSLLQSYTTKYGDPDFLRPSFPTYYELKEGYFYEIARWDLGQRTISIRIAQESYYYKTNLAIFRNDFTKRIKAREAKAARERQEAANDVI